MKYLAQLKHIDAFVEEAILLSIDGVDITCFANCCPYQIEVGNSYFVELTAQIFGEYCIYEIEEDAISSIEQVNEGLAHVIKGRLNGNRLEVGSLMFTDSILLSSYGYLEGKMVAWELDRIDAEFL